MGTSLLPEELNFVGFLPLQSYIDHKKTLKFEEVKCPSDKEVLLRSLILKEHIESLRCTIDDLKQIIQTEEK